MLKGLCGVDEVENEVKVCRMNKVLFPPDQSHQPVFHHQDGENDVFDFGTLGADGVGHAVTDGGWQLKDPDSGQHEGGVGVQSCGQAVEQPLAPTNHVPQIVVFSLLKYPGQLRKGHYTEDLKKIL